jgi:TPR repeat protein
MRFRHYFCFLACLAFGASPTIPQVSSPSALRAAARAMTTAQISGLATQASGGNTEAALMIGLTFQLYAERMRDDPQASADLYKSSAYWFRKASAKGSAPALYFLAASDLQVLKLAERAAISDPPPSTCVELSESINKAISQNYAPAMTALGQLYMDGRCRKSDYKMGLQWLKKAAESGDAEACYFIGIAYEQGTGVAADQAEATRWFLNGAQMGDPSSQNKLGINLAEGIGTPAKNDEAVEWFQKGAEQGNDEAACNLALHYMRGQGVSKDYVASLMWGLIADVNGTEFHCLAEIDTRDLLQMTPTQVAEATERANVWLKEHHFPPTEAPHRIAN